MSHMDIRILVVPRFCEMLPLEEMVKGTWDLFVLFLKNACESTVISR